MIQISAANVQLTHSIATHAGYRDGENHAMTPPTLEDNRVDPGVGIGPISGDIGGDLTSPDISAVPARQSSFIDPELIEAGDAAPGGCRTVEASVDDRPTQLGVGGIRFDFNDGCRVLLPDGRWRVRLYDLDTANLLYDTRIGAGRVNSANRFFIRFRLLVEGANGEQLIHDYDATDRDVLIRLDVDSVGDTIAWFAQAAAFQRQHRCRLTCAMSAKLIPLFREAYPDMEFVNRDAVPTRPFYATYRPILYFNDTKHRYQPSDYQLVGLHRNAAEILGIEPVETPPTIALQPGPGPYAPPPEEPYVCIAVQSTSQSKYWNNPHGWRETVRFLKASGYRVICIDQKPVHGQGLIWNHIPHGVEDMTGDRPLLERAYWLRQATCFIGLSSGLSWLAWAVGTPVVMISGFTHPSNEFATPYRVINRHACNSCFNDSRFAFDRTDYMWCPRHAGTARQFECTRLITSAQVRRAIERVPDFGVHAASAVTLDISHKGAARRGSGDAPEPDRGTSPPCVAAQELSP